MNSTNNRKLSRRTKSLDRRSKRPVAIAIIGALVLVGLIAFVVPHIAGILSSRPGIAPDSGARSANRDAGLIASETAQESSTATTSASAGQEDSSAGFCGIKSTLDPSQAVTSSGSHPNSEAETTATAPLPLVLQPVDPGLVEVTPEQQQVIERLRQTFADMVGGPGQDPNDPDYLERWQKVQPEIDEQLKAQLGLEFFLSYETAAAQTQLANVRQRQNPE
ncbi:MAG: hypothetical protein JO232_21380 [Verrucomicrobia bacterium]|nr:hypothetical protein [Verrucomicrobiota bacterium]